MIIFGFHIGFFFDVDGYVILHQTVRQHNANTTSVKWKLYNKIVDNDDNITDSHHKSSIEK